MTGSGTRSDPQAALRNVRLLGHERTLHENPPTGVDDPKLSSQFSWEPIA